MKHVLFLGSSHVGALKTAYDRLGADATFTARFVAASGADIAYTQVIGDRLVPSGQSTLTMESLPFFYSEGGAALQQLFLENRPFSDPLTAFRRTAGSDDLSLEGLSTIFYVAGSSPVDFRRLDEGADPLPAALRSAAMEYLIGSNYPLRPQIDAIRKIRPDIRHAFIGVPLRHAALRDLTPVEMESVRRKRAQAASMIDRYLFDEVFLPDEAVLDDNLLSTRLAFFQDGRHETRALLGEPPERSDLSHANGDYGAHVLNTFVRRCLG